MTTYVDTLHKKINATSAHIVSAATGELNPSEQLIKKELKQQLETIQHIFAACLQTWPNKSVTHHSAHLLLSFVLRVVSPNEAALSQLLCPKSRILRLDSHPELNLQLCVVASRIFRPGKNEQFDRGCAVLANFIETAPGFDRAAFTKALIGPTEERFDYARLRVLSLLYKSCKGADTELEQYLVDQTEKHVFNDENKEANNYALLFEPFYQTVSEQCYTEKMHSNTQFCVNRSSRLFNNIEHMISNFRFNLSESTCEMLTTELLSTEQIFKSFSAARAIICAVCSAATDKNHFANKVVKHYRQELERVRP